MFSKILTNGRNVTVAAGSVHQLKENIMSLEKESSKVNYRNLFQELGIKEANSDKFSGLTTLVADTYTNKPLNRYYNVLAYDQSRVKVKYRREDIYINANHVHVPEANREYILSQGPLEQTVDHFWLMCHQVKTTCIVMLCRCYENSRDKSAKYWPSEVGEVFRTNVGLEIELISETDISNYVVRELRLTDTETGTSRDVKHLHYIHWPDFNVPDCPESFLDFLDSVRDTGCFEAGTGPPVIHCSAGIGRSGTFCLVDSCLVVAGKGKDLTMHTIRTVLLNMRTQRMGLIQTEDQLRFSVSAILRGMSRLLATAGAVHPDQTKPTERTNGKRASISLDSPPNSKKRKNSES